jgi:NitT/TauT family transport system permease protein
VKVFALQSGLIAALLLAWYLEAGPGQASRFILPSLSSVARLLPTTFASHALWMALKVTGLQVAGAFAIAAGLGFVMGIIGSRGPLAQRTAEPLLLYAFMAPLILLYPIIILVFGLGDSSKIVFGAINGFFPMALSTLRGFATVDRRLLRLSRSFGAGRAQELWTIRMPAARPMVFAGIRSCLALCIVAVIAGEILGSTGGLGYLIAQSASTLATSTLYTYIIITVVFSAIIHVLISRGETVGDAPRPR